MDCEEPASEIADRIAPERVQARKRANALRLEELLLRRGSLTVCNPDNGKTFRILTGKDYGLRWYTVKENGRVVAGYNKKLLDRQAVVNWLQELEEVTQ